ncbi:MAG: hypothetical protein RLZZ292_2515 [Bacteroidota bacterium]|jgi:outer membrane lipoprotein-sorting protein
MKQNFILFFATILIIGFCNACVQKEPCQTEDVVT